MFYPKPTPRFSHSTSLLLIFMPLFFGCGGVAGTTSEEERQASDSVQNQEDSIPSKAGSGGSSASGGSTPGKDPVSDEEKSTCIAEGGLWSCDRDCETSCNCQKNSYVCSVQEQENPTCGCDGKIYANETCAYAAGTSLNVTGLCKNSPDTFACGWYFCREKDQYCKETWADRPLPSGYACGDTPARCDDLEGVALCECLQEEREVLYKCEIDTNGHAITKEYLQP